jgi:hypothetical protein
MMVEKHDIFVGTRKGLSVLRGETVVQVEALTGCVITALAGEDRTVWALAEGRALWRSVDGEAWTEIARTEGGAATCLAPTAAGLLVGTEGARVLRLESAGLVPLRSFDQVAGRDTWYTPWGDPADTRSISGDQSGAVYVNVHVGGVVRSRDRGRSWHPTLDIETDVHQVLAHPRQPGIVFAAAAIGLGVSLDGGASWRFETGGLHARYSRAVAVAGDAVLVSASTGPSGRRAAIYRGRLDASGRFPASAHLEQCRRGLPEWFRGNIDTGCLAASDSSVAFGTEDGAVYVSTDGGEQWERVAKALPEILSVATL